MNKKHIVIYVLICLSMVFLIFDYLFFDFRYGMMRYHYGYYDQFPLNYFYLSSFLTVAAYITIFICIIYIVLERKIAGNSTCDILESRLASGEISIEEYKKIKSILGKDRSM